MRVCCSCLAATGRVGTTVQVSSGCTPGGAAAGAHGTVGLLLSVGTPGGGVCLSVVVVLVDVVVLYECSISRRVLMAASCSSVVIVVVRAIVLLMACRACKSLSSTDGLGSVR